jgi:hypothetical protein
MNEDEVLVVEKPAKLLIAKCFHLPGEYANCIVNASGELVMSSTEVRIVDGAADRAKNYHQYVVRCTPTDHKCLLCDKMYKAINNSSTNIINLHIKTQHPEVIPLNFMDEAYVKGRMEMWNKAEATKDEKKRKAPIQAPSKADTKVQRVLTPSSFLSPIDIVQAVLVSLVLGYLPLDFINNVGLRYLLLFFVGATATGKVPLGLSARSLGRRLQNMHDNFITSTKSMLADVLPPFMDYDPYGLQRLLSCQQDGWGTRDGKSHHLGFCLDFIEITDGVWSKANYPLCAEPFVEDSTAVNNMELINTVLQKFGIGTHNLTSCTQDTTPSSFNTFDEVDNVSQLMCLAHVLALEIKWSVEKCGVLDSAIASCQKLASLLKGKGSCKRRKLHVKACKEAGIKYRRVIAGGPKWGARAVLVSRILDQKAALERLDVHAAFSTKDQRDEWDNALADVVMYLPLLTEVLPLLDKFSQWTQVLSSSSQVTISLVRPAIADILVAITKLKAKGVEYEGTIGTAISSKAKIRLGKNMIAVAKSFETQHKKYFNQEFSDFYLYRFAEMFDSRTFKLMSSDGIEKVITELEVRTTY